MAARSADTGALQPQQNVVHGRGWLRRGNLSAVDVPYLCRAGTREPQQIFLLAAAGEVADAFEVPLCPVMACRSDDLADLPAGHVPDLHIIVGIDPDDVVGVVTVDVSDPSDVPF